MDADSRVVLDACVLANAGVCDLLLRLAESPRMLVPVWSQQILDEVQRTHLEKLQWPEPLSTSFRTAVTEAFPSACVTEYEHLIPELTNDEKDRHVLAVAIRSGSTRIVTFNLKDFPSGSLTPWSITAIHPQDFLLALHGQKPEQVMARVRAIAGRRNLEIRDVLQRLGHVLPKFTTHLLSDPGQT